MSGSGRFRKGILALLLLVAGLPAAGEVELPKALLPYVIVPPPAPRDFLAAVRKGHPRLLLTPERQAEIRTLLSTSEIARNWARIVRSNLEPIENEPPLPFLPLAPGVDAQVNPFLFTGRSFADRVFTLGYLATFENDARAFDRLRKEVRNVLDTWTTWSGGLIAAEVSSSLALAYDWCFASWTPEERAEIVAILEKEGLRVFLTKDFKGLTTPNERNGGGIYVNNVALVQNGGAAVTALALAEESPELAGEVLTKSFAGLQAALPGFGTEGAWIEGLGYWNFACTYLVQTLASYESACGSDFGLLSTGRFPGVLKTADFPVFLSTPNGESLGFADAKGDRFASPALLWLGAKFDRPLAVRFEEAQKGGDMRGGTSGGKPALKRYVGREVVTRLLYYKQPSEGAARKERPLDASFPGAEIAVFRGAWDDPNASFVGVKAGSARGNRHAHLDAGKVIFDALGERWLDSLGAANYVKDYFTEKRFTFFHARTEAQNTVLVDPDGAAGGNQRVEGASTIEGLRSEKDFAACRVDLSDLVEGGGHLVRFLSLTNERRNLVVRDEADFATPRSLRWHVYTKARAERSDDGRTVRLTKTDAKGRPRRVDLELLSEEGSQTFVVEPAAALPGHGVVGGEAVKGFTRVAIVCEAKARHRIEVRARPVEE